MVVNDSRLVVPSFKYDNLVCYQWEYQINQCQTERRDEGSHVLHPYVFVLQRDFNYKLVNIDQINRIPAGSHNRGIKDE